MLDSSWKPWLRTSVLSTLSECSIAESMDSIPDLQIQHMKHVAAYADMLLDSINTYHTVLSSVSWCWSWEKEGRAVEVAPGI